MSYKEQEISWDHLERHLVVLDSDEGIRIENKAENIFINKTSKRYCVEISTVGKDDFLYMNEAVAVLDFLTTKISPHSRIFSY